MDNSQGIFYSAVQKEPEMHPLIELGLSLSPYVGGAYLAGSLASSQYPGTELTRYDMGLKSVRNTLNKFPMGFLNTFRIAEAGSTMMTGAGLGLDLGESLADSSVMARQQVIGKEFINKDTLKYLKSMLGDEFSKAEADMLKGNYQLVFEMEKAEYGKGSLFLQEMEDYVVVSKGGGKELKQKP